MKKETKEFLKIADNLLKSYIKMTADDLLECYPDRYRLGTTDYGHYHNGVGFASCGGEETIYDTKRAYNDALESVQEQTDNCLEDLYFHFTENKEFVTAFNNLIESYRK